MMTTMGVVAFGGGLIFTVALLATTMLRKASASLRHVVWMGALVGALVLPFLEWSGLRVEVPVPASWMVLDGAAEAAKPGPVPALPDSEDHASDRPHGSHGIGDGPVPARVEGVPTAASSRAGAAPRRPTPASAPSGRSAPVVRAPDPERSAGSTAVPVRASERAEGAMATFSAPARLLPAVATAVGAIWSFGALVLLMATLFGQFQARRLTVSGVEDASIRARRRLAMSSVRMGLERPVRLVVSDRVEVPATWGFRTAHIVLPRSWERWSDETLDRVLLHELAHVRRADCLGYLIGDLARAVHWLNPLAWLAVHRLRTESERASDDEVLSQGDVPSEYAQDLVSIARGMRLDSELPRAVLAMARPVGVAARVRAILDPGRPRETVRRPMALLVALVGVVLASAAALPAPVAEARSVEPTPAAEPEPTPGDRAEPDAGDRAESTLFDPAEPSAESRPEERVEPVEPVRERTAASGSAPVPMAGASGSRLPEAVLDAPELPSVYTGLRQERLCVFEDDGPQSSSTHVDDDEIRIRWETDSCRVEVDMEGEVEFAADDTGVIRLGRDALFEIEERVGRTTRRIRIEGTATGAPERRYWVDGDEEQWGPAAEAWLAAVLPEMFRHTTINAEARVRRMLDEGGSDRIFAEVAEIHSDHVTRRYLELMMEFADLDDGEYVRVIEAAGRIDSDHGAGSLLLAVIEQAGLRDGFQDPLLRASEGIDSDHQRTRVLEELLRAPLTPAQFDAVLRSASTIESDHNLSGLLSTIAASGRLDDAGRASFLRALRSVESDHSHATVVHGFLDTGPLSTTDLAQVLDMTEGIESDHQRADILQRVAAEYELTGDRVDVYLRSASEIESDHQLAETATAIIGRTDLDTEHVLLVLRLADDVESDHQHATILDALVRRRALSPAEVGALLESAEGIESDHQLAETLTGLVETQELDADGVEALLRTVAHVGSSHQRSSVLLDIARRVSIEGASVRLYRDLADDLSRNDRERVMAAIAR